MQATERQVREYYEDQGYEVEIDHYGHIRYRHIDHEGIDWVEGRWVSEYCVIDGQVILI